MTTKPENPLLQQGNRQSASLMHQNRFLRKKTEK